MKYCKGENTLIVLLSSAAINHNNRQNCMVTLGVPYQQAWHWTWSYPELVKLWILEEKIKTSTKPQPIKMQWWTPVSMDISTRQWNTKDLDQNFQWQGPEKGQGFGDWEDREFGDRGSYTRYLISNKLIRNYNILYMPLWSKMEQTKQKAIIWWDELNRKEVKKCCRKGTQDI